MSISENEKKVLARAGRVLERELKESTIDPLDNIPRIAEMMQYKISLEPYEKFCALLFSGTRLVSVDILQSGSCDSAAVYPANLFKHVNDAIRLHGPLRVCWVHQHPSLLYPTPSDTDIRLTSKLGKVMRLLDVETIDHIVVSGYKYSSMRADGQQL